MAAVAARALDGTHAFHSPQVEPVLGEFEAVGVRVTYAAPRLGWVSTLTGAPVAAGGGGAATGRVERVSHAI